LVDNDTLSTDGFAEVFPEHKYQVVEMLQQRGHLTAMTGDVRL
jgi:H+-transporting ATPase